MGDAGQAEYHFTEALRLRPEYAEVHNNLAILLGDMSQADRAQHHYREALRIRPDYFEAHYNFALALENAGRQEDAEASYQEALRLRPEYPEAINNLAILLQMRGDLKSAEACVPATRRTTIISACCSGLKDEIPRRTSISIPLTNSLPQSGIRRSNRTAVAMKKPRPGIWTG